MSRRSLFTIDCVAAALVALVFWLLLDPVGFGPAPERYSGLAVSFYGPEGDPQSRIAPSAEAVLADLVTVSKLTSKIRTYSSLEPAGVPQLAEQTALRVFAGIWLGRDRQKNELELRAGLSESANESVDALVVGNEVLLRNDLPIDTLKTYLRRVRDQTDKPVSTAEFWNTWLERPDLVREVDFMLVHLLPYWQSISIDDAVAHSFDALAQLREKYPDKRIVVGEVGWPSHGDQVGLAQATPRNQARFVREFAVRANKIGLEYFLMEGIDQPWKSGLEGRVGGHWGVLDSDRNPKFSMGWPTAHPTFWTGFLTSLAVAVGLLVWIAHSRTTWLLWRRLNYAVVLTAVVCVVAYSLSIALRAGFDWALLPLGLSQCFMGMLFLRTVAEYHDRAQIAPLEGKHCERINALPAIAVHVACANEDPLVVRQSLEAIARLQGVQQVVVVMNNTHNDALKTPVRIACADLRFDYLDVPDCPGFKAQALDVALARTRDGIEWVAVLDADYVPDSNWLQAISHCLDDRAVGAVQSPQAHRGVRGPIAQMLDDEYEGFFSISMPVRALSNGIVQQGTMCVIRKTALEHAGGWQSDCITEDAELGVRLLKGGFQLRYEPAVRGSGLLPSTLDAWRKQRFRWAFGATQIWRRHWRSFVGGNVLSLSARITFLSGWMLWLSHALHLPFVLGAIAWTLVVIAFPAWTAIPAPALIFPIFVFALAQAAVSTLAQRRFVVPTMARAVAASWASYALAHTVARAVWAGVWNRKWVFHRTDKGRLLRTAGALPREELILLLGLAVSGLGLHQLWSGPAPMLTPWTALLALLAIPYLAAVSIWTVSVIAVTKTAPAISAPHRPDEPLSHRPSN